MKVNRIAFGALALTVMVSCGKKPDMASILGGGDATPQEYKTLVLNEQDVVLESVYPVTIKGQEDIEIRPRIDGFIDQIFVDEGSIVKQGQTLFKINSPKTEQELTVAKAAVESAKATVATAQLNVDRIRPLAEKNIVSEVQLRTVENALQNAKAAEAQALASLRNAQATMSWTNVSSPVNGVVGSISFRKGSLVNNSNILTTVANTSSVFAYFSLDETGLINFLNNLQGNTQAEKIKNIPPITLTLKDGTVYSEKGKIETIAGIVNQTTGASNFRAEFPNKNGELRSGFSGNISIPKTINSTILVPQEATFTKQNKHLIYKVQGDSVVQTLISVIPTPDGKSYVITDGLKKGDRIVQSGIITLKDGAKIIVK